MSNNMPKSSMREKICYGLSGLGANYVWTFMAIYVTMYYTNSVGIAAAAAGTMMLVARLLDGISDILFAWLIQRVHFKMGKIKPWIIISAPLLAISLLASFNVPVSLSDTGKLVYVYITYSFTAAVSYTIFNLVFASTLPLISFDEQDRVKASSVYNFIVMGGIMIMQLMTPALLAKFGGVGASGSWRFISILYSAFCLVGVLLMGIVIQEKEMPAGTYATDDGNNSVKPDFKETMKILLTSKYTWMLLAVFFLFYLYNGATSGMGSYYFMYVVGDTELSSFGLISSCGTIAQFVVFIILPFLITKIGRKRVVIGGLAVAMLGSIAILINPTSMSVIFLTTVVKTFGITPIITIIYIFVADITDEIASKHDGYRPAEVVSMISSIGTKLGTGIGAAMVGWSLELFAFDANQLVQSEHTVNSLIQYQAWVPVITLIIVAVILSKWDLGADAKKTKQNHK